MNRRWVGYRVLALTLALTSLPGVRAFAANATLVGVGAGQPITITPNGTVWAGTLVLRIDGAADTNGYCVDVNHSIVIGDTVPQVPPTYPCEVLYVLGHYFPTLISYPGKLANNNDEASAIQAAIWHFTDAVGVTGPAAVAARAAAIVQDASTQCQLIAPVPQSVVLTPASATNRFEIEGLTHAVTAEARDTNGALLPGRSLHFAVSGAAGAHVADLVTDASGRATFSYTNAAQTVGTDTITASIAFTAPVGLEFKLPTKQGIVLTGTPTAGTVTGTATKTWEHDRCGNGVQGSGEECDDGNRINGDGCDDNCRVTGCGNGVVTGTERCDDGNRVDGDGCDNNCTPTACDNGIRTAGEACDDGNRIDGDGCDSNCTPTGCGNGVVSAGEQCDDGNLIDNDGCDSNCTAPGCGNGIRNATEGCDDGNAVSGDGCDSNCRPTGCGNGVVTAGEQCDDGNLVDGDGCDRNCTPTGCGNGVTAGDEECDDGNTVSGDGCDSNCRPTGCGNGILSAGEGCDDGNAVNGDGCDANCTVTSCGNGIVSVGEVCDDGNTISGDGCDANCTPTDCGNGIVTTGEACDDGNTSNGDGCDNNCTLTACGNDITSAAEQCDDGNLVSGDGCDANCTFTACGNGIVTAGEECDGGPLGTEGCDANCTLGRCGDGTRSGREECDDGNTADGDGCDSNCRVTGCGNGVQTAGEECDDGNTNPLDLCGYPDCRRNPMLNCPAPLFPAFAKKATFRHRPFERWQTRGDFIIARAIDPETQTIALGFTHSPDPEDPLDFEDLKTPADPQPFKVRGINWQFLDLADSLWTRGKMRLTDGTKVRYLFEGRLDSPTLPSTGTFKLRQSITVGGRCFSAVLECEARGGGRLLKCVSVPLVF